MSQIAERPQMRPDALLALGSRLREIREQLIRANPATWGEWTQTGVAQKIDMARGLISLAEHGRQRPSVLLFQRLLDLYGCSAEVQEELRALYGACPATPNSKTAHSSKGGRPVLPPHLRRMDQSWVRLNPEERRRIQRLSGSLQITSEAGVIREGLLALEEREAKKAR